MPSGAMASGLRLAGTRFLVTLLLLLLLRLPVTCFVSYLLSVDFFSGASMGKDLFMTIRKRCPLCCRCRWPGVAGGGGGGGGGEGGGTASSRPLSATSKSTAAIIKVQTEDDESQGHHPAIPMAICEKFNSPLSSIETFPPLHLLLGDQLTPP